MRPTPSGISVGVDPGKRRSGFVVVNWEPIVALVEAGRWKNEKVLDWLWDNTPDWLVVEDFRVYAWVAKQLVGNDLSEVRVIGAIQEIARRRGLNIFMVSPSDSKRMTKDWELREMGLQVRNAHVNDAFRVMVTGMKKEWKSGE